MKSQFSKFKKVLAIALLLTLLLSLTAMPAAANRHHTDPCANASDYDQCVSGRGGQGPAPTGSHAPTWHVNDED